MPLVLPNINAPANLGVTGGDNPAMASVNYSQRPGAPTPFTWTAANLPGLNAAAPAAAAPAAQTPGQQQVAQAITPNQAQFNQAVVNSGLRSGAFSPWSPAVGAMIGQNQANQMNRIVGPSTSPSSLSDPASVPYDPSGMAPTPGQTQTLAPTPDQIQAYQRRIWPNKNQTPSSTAQWGVS